MLLLREFYPVIDSYINIAYFFAVIILLGIATAITEKKEMNYRKFNVTKNNYIYSIILGILVALTIYLRFRAIGAASYLIAIVAGLLLALVTLLMLNRNK